jgi:hypothetical protein
MLELYLHDCEYYISVENHNSKIYLLFVFGIIFLSLFFLIVANNLVAAPAYESADSTKDLLSVAKAFCKGQKGEQ